MSVTLDVIVGVEAIANDIWCIWPQQRGDQINEAMKEVVLLKRWMRIPCIIAQLCVLVRQNYMDSVQIVFSVPE